MATPSLPSSLSFPPLTKPTSSSNPTAYLILFIPGNPGLVAYYTLFLSHLHTLLSSSSHLSASSSPADRSRIYTHGISLLGFHTHGSSKPPVDVQGQIEFVERELRTKVEEVRKEVGRGKVKVVLMGHSFGAFVLMEVLRRSGGWVGEVDGKGKGKGGAKIVGGVLLFPTIMEMRRSRNGRRFAPLHYLPFLPLLIHYLLSLLLLLPPNLTLRLLHFLTAQPFSALHTTHAFLRSPSGVYQALSLARDELHTIDKDIWGDEIWGSKDVAPGTRLRFLWGKEDGWVDSGVREEIVRRRGRMFREGEVDVVKGEEKEGHEGWRAVMDVDESGWEHSFCLKQSEPVAEKVRGYVEDIIKAEEGS